MTLGEFLKARSVDLDLELHEGRHMGQTIHVRLPKRYDRQTGLSIRFIRSWTQDAPTFRPVFDEDRAKLDIADYFRIAEEEKRRRYGILDTSWMDDDKGPRG